MQVNIAPNPSTLIRFMIMTTNQSAVHSFLTNYVHHGAMSHEPEFDAKLRRQALALEIRRTVEPLTHQHEWESLRKSAIFIDQIAYGLWHSKKPEAENFLQKILSRIDAELPSIKEMRDEVGSIANKRLIQQDMANLLRSIVNDIHFKNTQSALEEFLDPRLLRDGKYDKGQLDIHLRKSLGDGHGDIRLMYRPGWIR